MSEPADEGKIRELFQELRREDERGAPSFAGAWNVARTRQAKSRHRWTARRFATVAAVLALLSVGWWMASGRFTRQLAPVEIAGSDPSVAASATPSAMLISQWRSPTESLLHVPGQQLFKRVPRLDESVVNIKTAPDEEEKS